MLARHQVRDIIGAFAQKIAGAAKDFRTLEGRDMPPLGEAFLRRGERQIEIRRLRPRDRADRLFGRRIDDVDRLAGGAGPPCAIDQKQNLRIVLGH